MHRQPHERVVGEAPVDAEAPVVERLRNLHVRDVADLQVVEDVAARAGYPAEVFVGVGAGVGLLQDVRALEEVAPEPARVHGQVVAVIDLAPLHDAVCLHVHPVGDRRRRVVGVELPRLHVVRNHVVLLVSAAKGGLDDGAAVLHSVELRQLLEPNHVEVADGRLDALDLPRLVEAAEQYLLPRRDVGATERRGDALEVGVDLKVVDCPEDLLVDGIADVLRHLDEHHGVCPRVLHDVADDFKREQR